MNIKCPQCTTVLWLNENEHTEKYIIVQCPKCTQKIKVQLKKPAIHETVQVKGNQKIYVKPKMFVAPFSFEGRIRRLEYGISMIISTLILYFIESFHEEFEYGVLLIMPVVWFIMAQSAKRCHDLGKSGWWQLIPFYGFWLLFQEGNKGENLFSHSLSKLNSEVINPEPSTFETGLNSVIKAMLLAVLFLCFAYMIYDQIIVPLFSS